MEAAISQPKTAAHQFCASTPKIGAFRPNVLSFPVQIDGWKKKEILKVKKYGKGDSASAWLMNEDELNLEEELKKLNGKYKGVGGIVELMECLEREAIMGEDDGREASDYNRRALIFDRSSGGKQRAKVKEKLDKCVKEKLIDFCDVLNIPVNKATVKTEELLVKLLEFLESPQATSDMLFTDKEKGKKRKSNDPAIKSPGSSNPAGGKYTKELRKERSLMLQEVMELQPMEVLKDKLEAIDRRR